MKLFAYSMLPLAVAFGLFGCDWRKLDAAVERAPVLSVGTPSGYSASDLGRLVVALPLGDNPAVSARFFVAATTGSNAALIELDAAGKPTTYNVPGAVLTPVAGQTFTSLALVVRPDEAHPSVLLGTANTKDINNFVPGAVWRLHIEPGPTFRLDPAIGPVGLPNPNGTQRFGRGLAVGHVTGLPTFEDWAVVSDHGVALIQDGAVNLPPLVTPSSTCHVAADPRSVDPLENSRYHNARNPAIGDLIPGLPGGEIAVGVPRAAGGSVVLLAQEADPVSAAPFLGCPMSLSVAGFPSFGTAVVAGDVNGDGILDLVVGAPAAPAPTVFVYLGPFDPALTPAAPSATIAAPAGTQNALFGLRIVLADLDGQPGLEIAVSAPRMPNGTVADAGAVYLFNAAGVQLPVVLTDQDPATNGGLGEALAVVPFRNAACAPGAVRSLLVAGANEEVFTYFTLPGLLPEPRCFPAP